MTEQIKSGYWLDYAFTAVKPNGPGHAAQVKAQRQNHADYLTYLNKLNDEDFLEVYNRVREAESNLD